MSFLIYLHKNDFQPEEPQIIDGHLKCDTQLTFIDFVPSIIKRSSTSIISSNEIEYHPFKKMIETANEWLKENLNYEVINCETISIFFKYNDTQNYYDLRMNDISHYIYGTEKNNLLKALRLWVKRKANDIDEQVSAADSNPATDADLISPTKSTTVSPDTSKESPKLSELSSVLKRRWTFQPQPAQQLQKLSSIKLSQASKPTQNHQKVNQQNEPHSTDHSPKKSALQQQQAFRLQQYSSQSKFYLKKLQRQASCPQSNSPFHIAHNQQINSNFSAQTSLVNSTNPLLTHEQEIITDVSAQSHQHQSNNQTKTKFTSNVNPIKLNYVDIIPECNEINENNKLEKFERLDDCMNRLNDLIKNGLIKGRILSIETSTCEATVDWNFDTELSFTAITSKSVHFLRCFYLENEISEIDERLRIIDFIPDHLSGGGFFRKPKFENFSLVFPKVTEWLVNNPDYKFKNAQTLDIKMKNNISQNQIEVIDTKTMSFTEHGDYLRILRLVYSESASKAEENSKLINEQLVSINQSISDLLEIQHIDDDKILDNRKEKNGLLKKQDFDTSGSNEMNKCTVLEYNKLKKDDKNEESSDLAECDSLVLKLRNISTTDSRPIYLTSKLFLIQRKGQTIHDLRQEIEEYWYNQSIIDSSECKNTGKLIRPKIMACETMQIFCKQDDPISLQRASEETFMYNRFGVKNGYIVNVFRVYFDLGWLAFERLGYSLKLSQSQKMRQKRLNYSTSVDDEHLKEASSLSVTKKLSRRESVGEFFKDRTQDNTADLEPKIELNAQMRRLSCNLSSFEQISPVNTGAIFRKASAVQNDKLIDESIDKSSRNRLVYKSDDHFDEKKIKNGSETYANSEFSSLSMLANLSERSVSQSSDCSTSTSIVSNEDGNEFINQTNERPTIASISLKTKRRNKKLNSTIMRHQSIDTYQHENVNCLLM